MPVAKVMRYHGEPAILIDGVPYPPMTITTRLSDPAYIRALGQSGIKIFYVIADMRWNRPGDPFFKPAKPSWAWFARPDMAVDGLTETLRDIQFLMENVPDAYVMLRLNVSPPVSWINDHPQEQVLYSDGSHQPVVLTNASRYVPVEGMHSLCSEGWWEAADEAIREYFDEVTKSPYFDRVIGFFLCAGGTSEWYYPTPLVKKNGAYGDFSEPFRRAYENYLRRKYRTEENLRRAWKKPDASFERPLIPTVEERAYVEKVNDLILSAFRNWEYGTRGGSEELDVKSPVNVGSFLNVNDYRHVADFYDAWHDGTAQTIIHFASTLKKRFPTLLVGAFYGAYGCTGYFDGSTTTGTLEIMNSGLADFLAAPGTYNNREPGGIVAQREMQDSFRLRGQMFIAEDDSRTHVCQPWQMREACQLYSVEDTLATLKRDFARDLCEDIQAWWFDMGGAWYDDPKIIALFRRQQEIARAAYEMDRTKKNDIALLFDEQSIHCISFQHNRMVTDLFRTSDLGRIGAPVDYYFHDDMARGDMPDYRLYVMLNVYCLTDGEREAIHQKAKRNHATVLWLYAPGFINEDAGQPMDVSHIEKTVGMKVRQENAPFYPYFFADIEGVHPRKRYGYIDRDVHSNVWVSPTELQVPFVNPRFSVADETAQVLGRYCSDQSAAMAQKEMDGWLSVYCATPTLSRDIIAAVARQAGCHLFTDGDDVLYANENFVALHASSDGKKTIRFKRRCSPFDVYEQRYAGHDTDQIEVDMKLGETKMWCVNGEC